MHTFSLLGNLKISGQLWLLTGTVSLIDTAKEDAVAFWMPHYLQMAELESNLGLIILTP